ncbi:MAG TPA: Gldg family protein, partial [Verrucomicrobiae bacterium]|nr:Gldg family protein [Verrucomicrobiae bacterium]
MRRPALLLGVQVAAVAAILGCVLAIAALHPRRLDLTPERRFTLSPYTREVLGRLAGDVRIALFYSSQAPALRRDMTDLLALYPEVQPRITVRAFDLDRSPGMAKRLGVSNYNT